MNIYIYKYVYEGFPTKVLTSKKTQFRPARFGLHAANSNKVTESIINRVTSFLHGLGQLYCNSRLSMICCGL